MVDKHEDLMKKILKVFAILFSVFIIQPFVVAKTPEKRYYTAKHVNPHPPVIDGKVDDSIWEKVEWESDFIQRSPNEGEAPSQQTAFKILYDEKYVYVAVRAYDGEPEKIVRRMSRRDNLEGDFIEVEIDSYFDHRTAFSFSVSAAGVKSDAVISDDGQNFDQNWNPIWHVKTDADEQGWTAEMRIPLSQLRYGREEEQVWGLQITRNLFRKEEISNWQFIPRDAGGWVHAFGELHGLNGLKTARQIELYPYSVGQLQTYQREEGNPFATGRTTSVMAGLDGKVGLTSNLTLDFTINPDFGQVEADPSEVNLTAFETYFEEKRPFFIEGRNIFNFRLMLGDGDFSSDTLFYSRRIGRTPHYYPDVSDDEYVDMPQNTSILGAFKISGKTKSGISIGIIDSITGEEKAKVGDLGQFRYETVEPLTNYFGLRLQKDYNQGNTVIGTMVTATNRSIQNPELDFLHSAAYSGGLDFYHSWKDRTYFLQGDVVFSHVRGSTEALLRTQQAPQRYFQRPDADHVSIDPNRTSLAGYGGSLYGGKVGKGHLQYIGGVSWRSPGLELNDMGYLHEADMIMEFIWAGYKIWDPFSIFRNFNFNFNQWMGWDFSGEKTFEGGNFGIYGQFKNYYEFSIGINRNEESLSKSVLRGGPSLRWPGRWNTWINFSSDSRKKLRFSIGTSSLISDDNDSRRNSYSFGVTFIPSNALSFMVQPSYAVNNQELQYVSTKEFGAEDRYIFARIDQKTLAVTLRLNLCLTPDLSIQFYGQPFISAGKYSELKRITDSRAAEYSERFHGFTADEINYDADNGEYHIDENSDGTVDYSIDNPNFNFLQFRSNLILRWEYKPGSALFLIWSQGRTGYSSSGDFSFRNDLQDLFGVSPHNVFLIKFSYGFNL